MDGAGPVLGLQTIHQMCENGVFYSDREILSKTNAEAWGAEEREDCRQTVEYAVGIRALKRQ